MQLNLSFLADKIESKILSIGYEIPKSEIIGYLLEFFILDDKLDETKLTSVVGSVEKITTEIIALKDIQWPQAPWYGKEIKYPLEAIAYKTINQATSSQFMNFYRYLQMVLMLPSIFILIMVVLSFSLALIRGDTNSFTISIGISVNSLFIFYYYGAHSIINYPITARISNNKQLRVGVDDMEAWLYNMQRLSHFQTFSFISFSLLMFMGSFTEVVISDALTIYESHPANGIPLAKTLLYILFTSFVYFQGLSKLNNKASGRILKMHLSKPSRRGIALGLSIITFSKSIITLTLANTSILFFDLVNSSNEGTSIETSGVETFFTILILIYFSLEVIILGYLKYSNPTPFTRLLRKNSFRNNVVQLINWIIFGIMYTYLSIRLLTQEINESTEINISNPIQEYLTTPNFIRIFILTLLHVAIMLIGSRSAIWHKGDDFDEELNALKNF
ncbi:MAG: hypothetical protein HeimC2_26590 [Candidatus Heimdallarchaeota archaeon LC_2]|nr:MAG: hypothetical protein HeimC2_26590 [Candidatus Heimdallarchaeota archaeon LC_2]